MIAVSGGRDSVALLHALVALGWRKLMVLHLNHALRGRASDADEAFVRRQAEQLGLRCATRKVRVRQEARDRKGSIETAGREARRAFFSAMARKHRCRFLFTAHQAGDQAETVLHRLARGASLHGISGMRPAESSLPGLTTIRPLLEVTRAEIDDYLARHGVPFREDASNASPDHTRNRVRHELLPLMNEVFRRDVRPLLARFAEIARRDDACLDDLARDFTARHRPVQADGSLRIGAPLRRQAPSIQSRILHHWLGDRKVPDLGSREIASALAMLREGAAAKTNLPGGFHLCRAGRRLWVEGPAVPTKDPGSRPRSSKPRS